ncbi:MAG: hypothetical protein A4E52_00203 [Pelotomaculum sp. PtaB.Bin013]|uniref:Alkaline shock response membrane anchor protein AmaP n=1 Tax=Pelotomaculum isophthalicicum JI TaxID=947010 RepID=A0A9X4H4B4_9FIRM|nr:alkaline shock response membrane anchor protein AmaP [Pelotomaculum isophthalicicum]MDF9407487.1 alkaline shock response membrane anchor protein AmaP [Pelotomaculum isophthalicicum JI]OPX91992.1 MAG: hypothetical protein A4E52_00203 [Pelotomaculum sp. PtaB.Bin013]
MRPFDRALLAVYTFFLTVIFVLFSAIMLGWTTPQFLLRGLFYPDRAGIFWALMAILILAGVRLFWIGVSKSDRVGRYVVLTESALGQIRVSIQAIENLVVKVVTQVNGVREVKPRIVSVSQGVGIQIRAVVTPDINVPDVSERIQVLVKEKVFEITGITVGSVRVSIDNISAQKPRVE